MPLRQYWAQNRIMLVKASSRQDPAPTKPLKPRFGSGTERRTTATRCTAALCHQRTLLRNCYTAGPTDQGAAVFIQNGRTHSVPARELFLEHWINIDAERMALYETMFQWSAAADAFY